MILFRAMNAKGGVIMSQKQLVFIARAMVALFVNGQETWL